MQRPILLSFLPMALSLGLAGCQSNVAYDYDRGAELGPARHFVIAPEDPERVSPAEQARIEQAIRRELEEEGLTLVRDRSSDLLVRYRLELEREPEESDLNVYGAPAAGFNVGEGANVMFMNLSQERDVQPAELVVEVVNPNNGELVWRASALMDFQNNASASERAQLLDDVVEQMFEHFPER